MRLHTSDNEVPILARNNPFRIRIAGFYEDLEAGLRIKVLLGCVRAGVNLPAPFRLDLWRFDWLRERSLRNIALSTTRGSALIIVSISRASWLPTEMEKWVTTWSHDIENHPAAFMVLLPKLREGGNQFYPLCEWLWRAAQYKPTHFFQELFEPAEVEHYLVILEKTLCSQTGKEMLRKRNRIQSPGKGTKQREQHIHHP